MKRSKCAAVTFDVKNAFNNVSWVSTRTPTESLKVIQDRERKATISPKKN